MTLKFTAEDEEDNTIFMLDKLISRKPDGTPSSSVYRKPKHTICYKLAELVLP